MRTLAAHVQQRTQASARSVTGPSLSVVVVTSSGSRNSGSEAAHALRSASRDMPAQLIFVAREADPGFVSLVERSGGEFVKAPSGSTRAEMCDLGMKAARGAIVAVRDDDAVGNADWMSAYRGVIPAREAPRAPAESVVMDTLVTGTAELADVAPPRPSADGRTRVTSEPVAAAF